MPTETGSVRVRQSLREVDSLPPGPEQVAAAERTMALADDEGDRQQQIQARINLVAVYEACHPGEHELPHLSWLLNELADPVSPITQRQRFEVLWECRFALARTRRSARIPLKIVQRVYADIEQRYRSEGVSPNLYAKHRALLARDTESEAAAQRWAQAWRESPRDELSDCAVCDVAQQARVQAEDGDIEGALGHAAEILDGGRRCGEEPHRLLGLAADWAMRLGHVETAEDYHRTGWALVVDRPWFAAAAAEHLIYLARAGRVGRAIRLAVRVEPLLDGLRDDYERLWATAIVSRVLRMARGHGLLPTAIGGRPAAEVIADLDATARDLSARFDQRNQTKRISRRVAASTRLSPYDVQASAPAQRLDLLERRLLGAPQVSPGSRRARPTSILSYADALYFASDALDATAVTRLVENWWADRPTLLPANTEVEHRAVAYLDRRALASQAARRSETVVDDLLRSATSAAEQSGHEATIRRTRVEVAHRAALAGDAQAWTDAITEVNALEAAGEYDEAAGALMALSRHPDPVMGTTLAQRAAELFRRAGKPHWEASALQAAGYAAAYTDPLLATTLLDRAFGLASQADRPQLAVAVVATQGKAAWIRGDLVKARALFADAVAGADHFGATDPFALRSEYAELLLADQAWADLREVANELADQAMASGAATELGIAHRLLGLAEHHLGADAAAVESLEPALAPLAERPDALTARTLWTLGSSWANLDRADLSVAPLSTAASRFGASGALADAAAAREAAGRNAQSVGQTGPAAVQLAAAAQLYRRLGERDRMVGSLTALAEAFSADERTDDALATLATVMDEARDVGGEMSIPEEERLLGRLELQAASVLARAARPDAAAEMFSAAERRLSRHGDADDQRALARIRATVEAD